jgi:hypothetical protein
VQPSRLYCAGCVSVSAGRSAESVVIMGAGVELLPLVIVTMAQFMLNSFSRFT